MGGVEEVQLVEEVVKLPKESQEIRVFLVAILADIKAGKNATEIASGNLPKLIDAVSGFEKLGAEAQHPAMIDLGGRLASDVTKVLTGKTSAA